jgi:flagellar protein FliO/FliZ
MTCSRLSIAAFAALAGVLTRVSTALAAGGDRTPLRLPHDAPAKTAGGSGGGGIVRTIVGLAIVIGVTYGLYWVLRQVKSSKETSASGHGLSAVATLPLGPNRALHMVRAGREVVLVGAGENGVTPIRTYSLEELESAGLLDPPDDLGGSEPGGPVNTTTATPAQGFPTAKDAIGRGLDALRQRTVRQ